MVHELEGGEVVGFEPTPLYAVMRSFGRVAHTERDGDVVHVWFYPDPAAPPTLSPEEAARAPLQAPVDMDMRGLELPRPIVAILDKLAELGPGAQLLVRHHRDPVLLYDKLRLRGYDARAERRAEGDYLVRIAPAWVFETSAAQPPECPPATRLSVFDDASPYQPDVSTSNPGFPIRSLPASSTVQLRSAGLASTL